VQFGEVCWGDVVRGRQNGAFMRAQEMGFYLTPVRRFLTSMLGDVAAYRKSYYRTNTPYFAIHDRITDALARLDDEPDQALVFCGHGLGCHIISTYVWDVGQIRNAAPQEEALLKERGFGDEIERLRGATQFCRLETLAGLFTFGNIAPLFVSGFPEDTVLPLNLAKGADGSSLFPGPKLSPHHRQQARWINISSPRDPFSFPLRAMSQAYANDERVLDVITQSPSLIPIPNPFESHTSYWRNAHVARQLASLVTSLVDAKHAPRLDPQPALS
jgi:hypothetical protein